MTPPLLLELLTLLFSSSLLWFQGLFKPSSYILLPILTLTALHYITLHYTALQCTTLRYNILHYTTLFCIRISNLKPNKKSRMLYNNVRYTKYEIFTWALKSTVHKNRNLSYRTTTANAKGNANLEMPLLFEHTVHCFFWNRLLCFHPYTHELNVALWVTSLNVALWVTSLNHICCTLFWQAPHCWQWQCSRLPLK